jgi:hypothetical protein
MSAAPTPITARKAISISGLTEKAVTSEASPKNPNPVVSASLRPKRSPGSHW